MDIKSQSEIASRRVHNFFTPSGTEAILYSLLSIILLVIYSWAGVVNKLSPNYLGPPEELKTNFTTLITGFNNYFATALDGRLGQIVLWSFIGALSYIGLWVIKNILNSFENDIISDHYLHPSSYSRAGYWGSAFSAKIFLIALCLITAAFLFISLLAIWPSIAALAASAAYNFRAASLLYILFSLAAGALVIYIARVLFKLIFHLWKLL